MINDIADLEKLMETRFNESNGILFSTSTEKEKEIAKALFGFGYGIGFKDGERNIVQQMAHKMRTSHDDSKNDSIIQIAESIENIGNIETANFN